jgi:hypothetical protein
MMIKVSKPLVVTIVSYQTVIDVGNSVTLGSSAMASIPYPNSAQDLHVS